MPVRRCPLVSGLGTGQGIELNLSALGLGQPQGAIGLGCVYDFFSLSTCQLNMCVDNALLFLISLPFTGANTCLMSQRICS